MREGLKGVSGLTFRTILGCHFRVSFPFSFQSFSSGTDIGKTQSAVFPGSLQVALTTCECLYRYVCIEQYFKGKMKCAQFILWTTDHQVDR